MAYGNRAYSEATYSGLGLNPNATVGVTGVSATGSVRDVAVAGESEHPVTSEPIAITLGTVSVEADAPVNVTSPQLSSTLNSVTVSEGTGVTVDLTGVTGSTALGTALAAIFIIVT